MKKELKLIKIFKLIVYVIFFLFFCTVLLSVSGYYQTELQKKTTLTNEAIKQFENDIAQGKDIDINDYVDINKKDYDNNFTKSGRYISEKLNNIISTGIKKTLKIIIKAIED